MATRWEDWFWQANRDLEQARSSASGGFYEWACFASHQAAEKAVKAVFQRHEADAWGHLLADLLQALPSEIAVSGDLLDCGKQLDKHYIAPRYPDSLPHGAPGQSYTQAEAERAIENADRILRFCQSHLLR